MQSHSVGNIQGTRQGAIRVTHTWLGTVNNLVAGKQIKLATISGSPAKPSMFKITLFIPEAFNSSTATLTVGPTPGSGAYLTAYDLKSATFNGVPAAGGLTLYMETDSDLYMVFDAADVPTTGKFVLVLESHEVNATAPGQ